MTHRSRNRALAGGGIAAATTVAGAALLQRRHHRLIAADPADAVLRGYARGSELTVRSADGTRLHAESFGADGAPTIVLAHGWTEALGIWAYVIAELESEFRVVAYDLRGHGRSGPAVGGDYSLARFGDDVEAILAAAVPGGRVRTVAGHSLGAMSIAAWAETHDVGARAESAALLNTGLGDLLASSAVVRVPAWARRFSDPVGRRVFLGSRTRIPTFTTPASHATMRYLAFGPDATPGVVEFTSRMIGATPRDVRAAVGVAMADMELHHALARLTIPTLVMAGERDRLTPPSHARRIAAELPNLTELIEVPGAGHMSPLERPVAVATALRELALGVGSAPRVAVA
jgi:pimeloyl-ACP methyl ester carboxylesterase